MARKVKVDNRIPLPHYYRIADDILKQASIYREENKIVDLYIALLRYGSLVVETITDHRDFWVQCPKERGYCKKQLRVVVDELESLKEKVSSEVNRMSKTHASRYCEPGATEELQCGSEASSSECPPGAFTWLRRWFASRQ